MDETYIHDLLKRFTENRLTPEEYLELRAILLNKELDPAISKFMDTIWDKLDTSVPFDKMRAEMVYEKIMNDDRFMIPTQTQPLGIKKIAFWAKVAAGLFLVTIMALSLNRFFSHKSAVITYTEYTTEPGKRMKIILPDGSKVWLNAGSNIRFPQKFNEKGRSIELKGEAFFDVVHDISKPFVIHTNKVSTQVLGTAFNVSAYNHQPIEVTVVRGMVSVSAESRRLGLLCPNQQLDYDTGNHLLTEHTVDAALYSAWTQGELVLNNVSMAQAAEIISRWYNVKIIFKNTQIKKCRFVVSFPNNAELQKVMAVISKLNNFKYKIDNRNIYLSGKGCNN